MSSVPVKNVKMARRLTFTYFSVVSFIIVLVHFFAYYTTFESIEKSLAKDRFNEVRDHAEELLNTHADDIIQVSPHIFAYRRAELLPDYFTEIPNIDYDEADEIHIELNGTKDVFYMKTKMLILGKDKEIWLLNHKDVHDFNRDELFLSQKFQILVALLLLAVSLVAVQKISHVLTDPLNQLASHLRQRSANDHTPIPEPKGMMSQELEVLVNSLNSYQKQISDLIERERAFNQHASHELRTPLMVIKGALSLLKESAKDDFSVKQQTRISQASEEINEFVTVLLELARESKHTLESSVKISKQEVLAMIDQYQYLLAEKQVQWSLDCPDQLELPMPISVYKILLGNLVKNSYCYTDKGCITIKLSDFSIIVTDTGVGLNNESYSQQGYGLGLVIVSDICRNYQFDFELQANNEQGCTAQINFSKPLYGV